MQRKEAEAGGPAYYIGSIRLAGVALLALFLLDVVESAVPLQWLNPAWDLQVIGAVIERSPVPLLGFLLFFYGDSYMRTQVSRWLACWLSWSALAGGMILLLLLPLLVSDTSRVVKQAETQITNQLQQQVSQTDRLAADLKVAPEEALETIRARLGRPADESSPEAMRESLTEELRLSRENSQSRAREAFQSQRLMILKRSWKWGLQAVVVACVLVVFWRQSGWARGGQPKERANA